MLTAATAHKTTATTAIAIPGLARTLAQLRCLIADVNQMDSARQITR
jgi:hypothetical protein